MFKTRGSLTTRRPVCNERECRKELSDPTRSDKPDYTFITSLPLSFCGPLMFHKCHQDHFLRKDQKMTMDFRNVWFFIFLFFACVYRAQCVNFLLTGINIINRLNVETNFWSNSFTKQCYYSGICDELKNLYYSFYCFFFKSYKSRAKPFLLLFFLPLIYYHCGTRWEEKMFLLWYVLLLIQLQNAYFGRCNFWCS